MIAQQEGLPRPIEGFSRHEHRHPTEMLRVRYPAVFARGMISQASKERR
jgi:hypothetical protein